MIQEQQRTLSKLKVSNASKLIVDDQAPGYGPGSFSSIGGRRSESTVADNKAVGLSQRQQSKQQEHIRGVYND